jgi:hypothetical protein
LYPYEWTPFYGPFLHRSVNGAVSVADTDRNGSLNLIVSDDNTVVKEQYEIRFPIETTTVALMQSMLVSDPPFFIVKERKMTILKRRFTIVSISREFDEDVDRIRCVVDRVEHNIVASRKSITEYL